jgi:NAD(P)-dependent dehydrogenase (short-subunit alcohol dehydrogenase family)
MNERVSLVTGGTDGIGRAVALELARRGDRVLFVGRNAKRAGQVLAQLRELRPGREHAFLAADLSLLADTSRVAAEVGRLTPHLDAVVCSAGILSFAPEVSVEGLERSFVLNYLSRYLLAIRLLPQLSAAASGRLVLVSNAGKYHDTLDFEELRRPRRRGIVVSGRTQFANDLLVTELASRLRGSRVEVTCVFPGVTQSACFDNARGVPAWLRGLVKLAVRLFGQSCERAAETPVFLAHDTAAVGVSGRFFGPGARSIQVPARASNPSRRHEVWVESERLVRAFV